VDHHVRIFPVLLYNIPPPGWPEACRATSGFRFHDAVERGFGKPLNPDHDDFTDQLCLLVDELHTVLTTMAALGDEDAAPGEEARRSNAVFLADVSDDLRRQRRQLQLQLESERIEVVSGVGPASVASNHEAVVREALRRSKLSVHLLGAFPGRPLDEAEPDKTFPVEQVRIGLEHAPSQLVVLPPGFDRQDIEEPEYAELLTSLQDREREAERLELIQVGREQLADEVLAKLRRLDAQREVAQTEAMKSGGNAFVDLHVNDLPWAGDLVGYLNEQNLPAITIPSGDLDPTKGMSLFEEHLRRARVFIVVFGRVARSWVEQRLNEAFKLILANRLTTKVGVYLAPPHKSAADLAFPPLFRVMDNTKHFDPKTVDALLREPTQAP
jgi:hypothetical protein